MYSTSYYRDIPQTTFQLGDEPDSPHLRHRLTTLSLPRTVSAHSSWSEEPPLSADSVEDDDSDGNEDLRAVHQQQLITDEIWQRLGCQTADPVRKGSFDLRSASFILPSSVSSPAPTAPLSNSPPPLAHFVAQLRAGLPEATRGMPLDASAFDMEKDVLHDPWRAMKKEHRKGLTDGGELAARYTKEQVEELLERQKAEEANMNSPEKPLPALPQVEEEEQWIQVAVLDSRPPLSPQSPMQLISLKEARTRFAGAHCLDLLPPHQPGGQDNQPRTLGSAKTVRSMETPSAPLSAQPPTPASPHPPVMLSPLIDLKEARNRFGQAHPRDISPQRYRTQLPIGTPPSPPRKRSKSRGRAANSPQKVRPTTLAQVDGAPPRVGRPFLRRF
ncbi:hypothetical protein BV25DRAFT_946713 [Artomyces pyxidatus]|uniref:Uncharacterized protein n=1 Tax=Artomyces pyxidatus TaxID=48021 RepID=A0ACB8SY20_9AGAM|nr:hypothetical protein BV25DRAFT_946713 [Artomyces pyxidatus]